MDDNRTTNGLDAAAAGSMPNPEILAGRYRVLQTLPRYDTVRAVLATDLTCGDRVVVKELSGEHFPSSLRT